MTAPESQFAKRGFSGDVGLMSPKVGSAVASFQGRSLRPLDTTAIGKANPLAQTFVAEFPSREFAERFIAESERLSEVLYAEIDQRLELFGTPNDPYFQFQWNLANTGQAFPNVVRMPGEYNDYPSILSGSSGADIKALAGLQQDPDTLHSPLIAIIDTGVDIDHPDLRNAIWVNVHEIPENGRDDDYNGFADDLNGWDFSGNDSLLPIYDDTDPRDPVGHGTHCAGIVAATRNNGLGITGICPQARIMALKIWPAMLSSIAARAIIYAVDNGADVISMSWGTPFRSQLLADAVAYANRKGVVLVAAMGNSGIAEAFYPAAYEEVIAVGATDSRDLVNNFSTRGDHIDLCAPGESILSLRAASTDLYGRSPSFEPYVHIYAGDYYIASGTSMAAPMVAAGAGWLRSLSPGLTAGVCAQLLYQTADDLQSPLGIQDNLPGWDVHSGWGRLNLESLIAAAPAGGAAIAYPNRHAILTGSTSVMCRANEHTAVSILEYGAGSEPADWLPLPLHPTTHPDSLVADWNLAGLFGEYTLRLRNAGANLDYTTVSVVNEPIARIVLPAERDTIFTSMPIIVEAAAPSLDSILLAYRTSDATQAQPIISVRTPQFGKAVTEWAPDPAVTGDVELILSVFASGLPEAVAIDSTHVVVSSPFAGSRGWRIPLGTTLAITPNYGDLDGDGENEIILGSDSGVFFFNLDGTPKLSGVPVLPPGNYVIPPVVCDLDEDHIDDLAIVSDSPHRIHLISSTNGVRSFDLSYLALASRFFSQLELLFPVLLAADLDADGRDEVLYQAGFGQGALYDFMILDHNGNRAPGLDIRSRHDLLAVADLNGDRALEIYTLTLGGQLRQFHRMGELKMERSLGGGELELLPTSMQTADIDRDGRHELVIAVDVKLGGVYRGHAVVAYGDSLIPKSNRIYVMDIPESSDPRQPTICDLQGDGRLEEIISYFDVTHGFLFALQSDGQPVIDGGNPNSGLFAVTDNPAILMVPLAVSIDNSPGAEIVAAAGHDVFSTFPVQRLYAWDRAAHSVSGWPLRIGADPHTNPARLNTPIFGDFDRDGQLDMMMVSSQRELLYTTYPGVSWDSAGSSCSMWRYNRKYNNIVPRLNSIQTAAPDDIEMRALAGLTATVFPNPFNAETVLEFDLPVAGPVELRIYNLLGQVVDSRRLEYCPQGLNSIHWKPGSTGPKAVASGVYFYSISSQGAQTTGKMLLLK